MSKNYRRKALVNLKEGSFLDLLCEQQYIMSGKPHVAIVSSAISGLISKGKMDWIAELDEDATQEDFNKVWNDNKGVQEKAVAAFLKLHGKDKKKNESSNQQGNNSSAGRNPSNQN